MLSIHFFRYFRLFQLGMIIENLLSNFLLKLFFFISNSINPPFQKKYYSPLQFVSSLNHLCYDLVYKHNGFKRTRLSFYQKSFIMDLL